MRFKDLLNEKYLTGFKDVKDYVEVFENPTKKELNDILKNQQGMPVIRFGATDEKNPTIYAWDGNILHHKVRFQVPFDFGFLSDPTSLTIRLQGDSTVTGKQFDTLEHKKEILNKIKAMFPSEKVIKLAISRKVTLWDLETGEKTR